MKRDALCKGSRVALHGLALAMLTAIAVTAIAAESYPTRPIRLVYPSAPGGALDVFCRSIAYRVSEWVGHRVFVDNRPGAGGMVGTELVVRAQPEGYTLGQDPLSALAGGNVDGAKKVIGGKLAGEVKDAAADGAKQGLKDEVRRTTRDAVTKKVRGILRKP